MNAVGRIDIVKLLIIHSFRELLMDKKKLTDATVGLMVFGAAMTTGMVKVTFDPHKNLALNNPTISIETARAHASVSSDCNQGKPSCGKGGVVC
jgi:hypothetical protein